MDYPNYPPQWINLRLDLKETTLPNMIKNELLQEKEIVNPIIKREKVLKTSDDKVLKTSDDKGNFNEYKKLKKCCCM